ncbi:Uncharacterized protein APZ42_016134 [Daphnia magna]|uniref:Uncharacterized protein n=1 Tax=Daphnia magna TaxID=35525 RepID=A0A162NN00_9CRUS|nr:Uncharacterized protein APZ42_016134 [Daphnia magna]
MSSYNICHLITQQNVDQCLWLIDTLLINSNKPNAIVCTEYMVFVAWVSKRF